MKRITMLTTLLTILSLNVFAEPGSRDDIQQLVTDSYVNGAFNKLDTRKMRKGFHTSFEILSADGEQVNRYPIANWIASVEKRKAAPDFDPKKYQYDYNFLSIEANGDAAAVKIEFHKNHKLVFTDYLLLLKFSSGWKIVSKVYHSN